MTVVNPPHIYYRKPQLNNIFFSEVTCFVIIYHIGVFTSIFMFIRTINKLFLTKSDFDKKEDDLTFLPFWVESEKLFEKRFLSKKNL